MAPSPRLAIIVAILLCFSQLLIAEQLATSQKLRLEKIQSRIEAFRDLDTLHVLISNAEGSPVTFNTRPDTTTVGQAWTLASGQSEPIPFDSVISLETQGPDTSLAPIKRAYNLERGKKYIIYWNESCWDLIRVGH